MILDFNFVIPINGQEALAERDRLINLLSDNGYRLVMTDQGSRVLMEQKVQHPKTSGRVGRG